MKLQYTFARQFFLWVLHPRSPIGGRCPRTPAGGPLAPRPPSRVDRPPGPRRGGTPLSALPHVEGCTYFWGVNTSWGINTAERKDLCIRKIIRLHNQQSPTWRLISTTPLLLYMLDFEPSWTWQISHFHLHFHS